MNYYGNNSHSLNPSCQFVCINACFARCGNDLCTGAKFLQWQKNLMQLLEKGSFTLSPWSQWLTMIKLVPINFLDGVLD